MIILLWLRWWGSTPHGLEDKDGSYLSVISPVAFKALPRAGTNIGLAFSKSAHKIHEGLIFFRRTDADNISRLIQSHGMPNAILYLATCFMPSIVAMLHEQWIAFESGRISYLLNCNIPTSTDLVADIYDVVAWIQSIRLILLCVLLLVDVFKQGNPYRATLISWSRLARLHDHHEARWLHQTFHQRRWRPWSDLLQLSSCSGSNHEYRKFEDGSNYWRCWLYASSMIEIGEDKLYQFNKIMLNRLTVRYFYLLHLCHWCFYRDLWRARDLHSMIQGPEILVHVWSWYRHIMTITFIDNSLLTDAELMIIPDGINSTNCHN